MKKCKKCGRPLGKNGLCGHCDRSRISQEQPKKKSKTPWLIGGAVAICAVILAVVLCVTLGGNDAPSGKHHVEIEIADYGVIAVELDADAAPRTVENFLALAGDGFYDGLTFHRIMKGFMMQGGDPEGNGNGGSGKTIRGEFSANGVKNPLSHTRGAISMARAEDMNSASSQFFIVHEDATYLDGKYACFGYVTSGMDVVDAVCEAAQPVDNNGTIPAAQQPVITAIRVID